MFPKHYSSFQARRKRSSAMIITLAAVLLVSAILLVFFDQSTLNRQISFSSAGQYRADTLAHTALDTIVGDLQNELIASSTNYTSNSITVYIPTNQGTPINQTVEPCAITNLGSTTPYNAYTNLITQSTGGSNFWTATYNDGNPAVQPPIRSAVGNSTGIPSFNDHFIDTNRWNKPGLLGDPGPGRPGNVPTNYISSTYIPPDWVIVTRSGALTNATTVKSTGAGTPFDLVDKTLGSSKVDNTNYVIGRYAYTIYNEGGLIDANVAGCPKSLVGQDPNTKRGVLPQINLADLLRNAAVGDNNADTDADNLVAWRNHASSTSSTTFTNYVYGNTTGFTTVYSGNGTTDQTFLSRQDLINYFRDPNNKLPTTALPFLATFTRELNAPCYTPPPLTPYGTAPSPKSKPKVNSNKQEGYYAANLPKQPQPAPTTDDAFNPSLINTRVTKSFIRDKVTSDGTTAQLGEPLIKYRFPLSRLAWIGYNGPGKKVDGTTASANDILSAFGLTFTSTGKNSGYWTYGHTGESDTDRIFTLAQVAALSNPREPDFFELLQAGMSIGSLGKEANNQAFNLGGSLMQFPYDSNPYYQIIQIGANLIDQADADSYPTRIVFAPNNKPAPFEFDGVENLPGISRIWEACYYHRSTNRFGVWYIPEVWNPNISTVTTGAFPTKFKFTVNGSTPTTFGTAQAFFDCGNPPPLSLSGQIKFPFSIYPSISANSAKGAAADAAGINFTINTPNSPTANPFLTPSLLVPGTLSTGVAVNATAGTDIPNNFIQEASSGGSTFVGIFVGEVPPVSPPQNYSTNAAGASANFGNPLTFQLWYQDGDGFWVAYNRHRREYAAGQAGGNSSTGLRTQVPSGGGTGIPPTSGSFAQVLLEDQWLCSDPRTDRFGMLGANTAFNSFTTPYTVYLNQSTYPSLFTTFPMRPSSSDNLGQSAWVGTPPAAWWGWTFNQLPIGGVGIVNKAAPYFWSNNFDTGSNVSFSYKDPDGVIRRADGAYSNGSGNGTAGQSYPLTVNGLPNTTTTPIILNRPFRSVADMGYAFRDEPWKHIDFFTQQSADAALLDLFCVNELPSPAGAVAGRVDLNTSQAPVLETLLTGAIQWDDGNKVLSTGDAGTLANNLLTLTTGTGANQGPLLNRSELVSRWMSSFPTLSPTDGNLVKRQREAAVRALADVGNTRTWNLLIDVIAQSGRYIAAGGSDLNKQFMVEGERRYWLHVAIDRYTGKVIAQSLEPVYE